MKHSLEGLRSERDDPRLLNRRAFIKASGAATIAAAFSPVSAARDTRENGRLMGNKIHPIPADKKLSPDWVNTLFARGDIVVYRGADLETIGMPIGGIGAGQLYLLGDGTLGCWQIFNRSVFTGYGETNYARRIPDKPVDQGFAVRAFFGDQSEVLTLRHDDFPDVEFEGRYPIGRIRYCKKSFPVEIETEAFSPFIPGNADDSGLPATLFHITVTNSSDRPATVELLGWLENAVSLHSGKELSGLRCTRWVTGQGRTMVIHGAAEEVPSPEEKPRPAIRIADFEGDDYGDWKTEGAAMGRRPATGTLSGQQHVAGFGGEGLVNSYLGGDKPHGTLTSPPFTINRRFINLLVGGGSHEGETCVNLLVDGRPVLTATGKNTEELTWRSWNVVPYEGRRARIQIVDRKSGSWGHINVDQIELSDMGRNSGQGNIAGQPDFGTMVLALDEEGGLFEDARAFLATLDRPGVSPVESPDDSAALPLRRNGAVLTRPVELAPGDSRTFVFVLAWHFPNHGMGHAYARRFPGATEVAQYVLDQHGRLARDTRLWHETWYGGSLPHWLLERLFSPVSTLASGTCQWWGDGRFWAWEGVGCCGGTCTHVWNYSHALARLFPTLERSVREMQDFNPGAGLDAATGRVRYRAEERPDGAMDGQAGTILKAWREHLISPNDRFLRRNWHGVRKVLEYLFAKDGDGNGVIEGEQHNTYDYSLHGPNSFVGSLYLAALLAAERMAREMGEEELAVRCRGCFERGRKWTVDRLFNGRYLEQQVDLKEHPAHQYATGCLSDQLFGEGWARQVGLGPVYPKHVVGSTLQSIWKYNWAPDVAVYGDFLPRERPFAVGGEAGLLNCTWPLGGYQAEGIAYRNEVWTGVEYQVAGHMAWEGMVTEALAICRGIHERYHPAKRNPWNEVECGDHYARGLSSYGVFLALCGFEYNGPDSHIGFVPKMTPENFKAAFTAGEGWGTLGQRRDAGSQVNSLEVTWGRLRIQSIALEVPGGSNARGLRVEGPGGVLDAEFRQDGERVMVRLLTTVELGRSGSLLVRVRLGPNG